LERASLQFGRRPNGIRGRLAKYFPDIAGWDYEGQKKRDEERKNKKDGQNTVSPPLTGGVRGGWEESKTDATITPQFNFSNNPEAQSALDLIQNTNRNLFLTGEAGNREIHSASIF